MKARDRKVVERALAILAAELQRGPLAASSTDVVVDFCRLTFGALEHEVFAVLFLDNQHTLIKCETLFRGTIDSAAVFPREVVKETLLCNAAAVIFVHNHPSGCSEPSHADVAITKRLQAALSTVDVRVLDHIVVSATEATSLACRGLI